MSKPKFLVIDVETTGLSPRKDKLHGLAIAWEEDQCEYHPFPEFPSHVLEALYDPTIEKVGHNVRFDLKFLANNGIEVKGRVWDTMLIAHLIDENAKKGLKELAGKYLGEWALAGKRGLDRAVSGAGCKNIADLCMKDILDPEHPYTNVIGTYAKEDVNNTLKLLYILRDRLKTVDANVKNVLGVPKGPLDYLVEEAAPLEAVLLKMELRGIRIDTEVINAIRMEACDKRDQLRAELYRLAPEPIKVVEESLYQAALAKRKSPKGKEKVQRSSDEYKTKFNWDSGPHVGQLFFEEFKVPEDLIERTKKGTYSTSEHYLNSLRYRLPRLHPLVPILETFHQYKKILKIATTYTGDSSTGIVSRLEPGPNNTQRIYAEFNPYTVTGRLSSSNPNMQNLPRNSPVKRFFCPDDADKVFVSLDYSQIELRVAAHLSQDPVMLETFQLDLDPHKITAAKFFRIPESEVDDKQRQVGKTGNFLIIFWGSAYRLQQELKLKNGLDYTKDQCQELIDNYFAEVQVYKNYLMDQLRFVRSRQIVLSETGRVRRLPEIVLGDYLNWKTRTFTGPPALVEMLKVHPLERLSPEETFTRASQGYSHAKKQAFNFPIQSLASSIMKRGMVLLDRAGYKLVNQVHDSVTVELPASELHKVEEIKRILENAYKLTVPLKCDVKISKSLDDKDKIVMPAQVVAM
jgi:DNA polymerase-1